MPKRKSSKRYLSYFSKNASPRRNFRLPYRLTMFIPNKPAGNDGEFIHSRPIDYGEAREITAKYKERVYLVSEEIEENDSIIGEPLIRLPELLIAMEAVPVGNMVISFDDRQRVGEELPSLVANGAHLLNDMIYQSVESLPGPDDSENAYVVDIVGDARPRFDWTGAVPPHIVDWVNLRFYAMSILNCCYIGRGAPTGVNLREQADMMSSNLELLGEFVAAVTSGLRELPEMKVPHLPAWQERMLWESRLSHHYQKALKQSESFREFFHYAPITCQRPEVSVAEEEFKNINQLMRHMMYAYEKGEENDIDDIIWTASGPAQMAEALDEIGAISTIEAYLMGVPIDDLMA